MSEIADGLSSLNIDSSKKGHHNVPLEHLDFKYVEQCDNVKELEKIYRVLISGIEGKYPDLERTVENKVKILNPNSRVLRKDCPITTRNSISKTDKSKLDQEINEFINSIPNLEKEIAREKELTAAQLSSGDSGDGKEPPIRTKTQPILIKVDKNQQKVTEKQPKPSTNKNVKPKDYREWEKIEKQLEKELDDKEEKPRETEKKVEEPIKVTKHPDLKKLSTNIEPCDEKLRPAKAEQEKCKGNEAFNGKSYDEAVIYYTRSIQYVENNPAAYNNRAMAFIKLEKWDKAIDDCNSVFKYEPENVKAYFRRGTAYFHKRKFKDAKNDLELVVAKEVNNKNAKELLTKINAELKKEDDERSEVKAKGGKRLVIEETDGESEEDEDEDEQEKNEEKPEEQAHKDVEMTVQEEVQQEKVEIKEEKKKIIEIKETENDEDDEESDEEKMNIDEPRQEEPVEEMPIQEQQSPPPPPQPEVQIPQPVVDFKDQANKLFQNGQYSDAIEYYSKAIHHLSSTSNDDQVYSNTLSILYSNRASCKQKIGNYKEAVGDCDMSLNFNKDNSKVLYKKAYSLELIEKYGDSLHEYEKLMRIDATHKQAQEGYNRVKKLLVERGHFKPKRPTNEESYEQQKTKGNEFVKINKYQEAEACYTKCIEIDSKNPTAYLNRSLCYIKLNKPDLAIQDCNYVLSVESNNVKGLYRRALAYKQLNNHQNAMIDLKTVISIEPNNLIAIKELDALKDLVKNQPQPAAASKPATTQNKTTDQNTQKETRKPAEAPKQNKPVEQTTAKPKPIQHKLPTKVTNSFEFLQAWNSITPTDIQSYCLLLEMIDANKLSAFIGSKLDDDMMCRLVSAFHKYLFVDYHENDTEDGYSMIGKRKFDKLIVYSYLLELSKTKRFDIVKSFLNNEYKKMLNEIFNYLDEQLKGNKTNAFFNSSDLESLKKLYN